jgi:hypothetical protein
MPLLAIFKLLGGVLKLLPMVGAYFAGRAHVSSKISKRTARAKARQAELAARPRRDARDLVGRMRDGDGQ